MKDKENNDATTDSVGDEFVKVKAEFGKVSPNSEELLKLISSLEESLKSFDRGKLKYTLDKNKSKVKLYRDAEKKFGESKSKMQGSREIDSERHYKIANIRKSIEKLIKHNADLDVKKDSQEGAQQKSKNSKQVTDVKAVCNAKNEIGLLKRDLLARYLKGEKERFDEIAKKVHAVQGSVSTSVAQLEKSLEKDFNEVRNKFNQEEIEIGNLKGQIKHGFAGIGESLEVLPSKYENLEAELESINKGLEALVSSKLPSDIPKDEEAIRQLTQFMRDGLDQFENIGKEYVRKQREFEDFEESKAKSLQEKEETQRTFEAIGRENAMKELAQKMANSHPSDFKKVCSVFGEKLSIRYDDPGVKVEVCEGNKEDLSKYIEELTQCGDFIIESPAYLWGDEVLLRAEGSFQAGLAEKSDQKGGK